MINDRKKQVKYKRVSIKIKGRWFQRRKISNMVFLFSPEVVGQVPPGEIGSSRGAQLIPGKKRYLR
jgi:hypothetical protein